MDPNCPVLVGAIGVPITLGHSRRGQSWSSACSIWYAISRAPRTGQGKSVETLMNPSSAVAARPKSTDRRQCHRVSAPVVQLGLAHTLYPFGEVRRMCDELGAPHRPSPWSRRRSPGVGVPSCGARPARLSIRRKFTIICSSMSFPRGASSTSVSGPNVTLNLPLRSSVVVPTYSSSDKTSRHSILPLVGWLKIFSMVSRW